VLKTTPTENHDMQRSLIANSLKLGTETLYEWEKGMDQNQNIWLNISKMVDI